MTHPDPPVPLDPDLHAADPTPRPPRPVHLSLGNVVLVAVGGAAGTGARYAISTAVPHWAGMPVGTLGINVTGAFLLGMLLQLLTDHRVPSRWSRRLRLGVGTGGLGGFTTYSALATDTATLTGAHPLLGAGYALSTVLLGAAATTAGIWVGRRRARPVAGQVGTRA